MKLNIIFSKGLLLLSLTVFGQNNSQKRVLQISDAKNWSKLRFGTYDISGDGKYVWYGIDSAGYNNMILKSTEDNFTKHFASNIVDCRFGQGGKSLILKTAGDSILKFDLNKRKMSFLTRGSEYHLKRLRHEDFLIVKYQEEVSVISMNKNTKKTYNQVDQLVISKQGGRIGLSQKEADGKVHVSLFDVRKNEKKEIWAGKNCLTLCINEDATQSAVLSEESVNGKLTRSIWYCGSSMDKAELKVSDEDLKPKRYGIKNAAVQFRSKGQQIYFYTEPLPIEPVKKETGYTDLEIWSYTDYVHYTEQVLYNFRMQEALFSLDTRNNKILQLTGLDDAGLFDGSEQDYMLVETPRSNLGSAQLESYWRENLKPKIQLICTKNGEKIKEFISKRFVPDVSLSPYTQHVVYFDSESQDFFSFDPAAKTTVNLTKSIPGARSKPNFDTPTISSADRMFQVLGWREANNGVFISDGYDIWVADVTGKTRPFNLTSGLGKANNIAFSFFPRESRVSFKAGTESSYILLKAIENNTKREGVVRLKFGEQLQRSSIHFKNYSFKLNSSGSGENFVNSSGVFLIEGQNAENSPNLFITRNFKDFKQISEFHDEHKFNWLKAELVNWNTPVGNQSQGILYKPENFDPLKRYPVIFMYYRSFSNSLNEYIGPQLRNDLSIPYYVSNGYLVFACDIQFYQGEFGKNAVECLTSAAEYLAKEKWVDSKHMGLAGYSFGGYLTNYVVSQTDLFAAAYAGAGASDLVSSYGEGPLQMMYCETWAYGMGAKPFERSDRYVRNSPVFYAGQVNTPLLMQANKDDGNVPFGQSVEYFNSLRRLGKKVWLINYPGMHGHGLSGPAQEDFVTRQKQFFDHYLLGKPAPQWMIHGIPYRYKGLKTGLELDAGKNDSKFP